MEVTARRGDPRIIHAWLHRFVQPQGEPYQKRKVRCGSAGCHPGELPPPQTLGCAACGASCPRVAPRIPARSPQDPRKNESPSPQTVLVCSTLNHPGDGAIRDADWLLCAIEATLSGTRPPPLGCDASNLPRAACRTSRSLTDLRRARIPSAGHSPQSRIMERTARGRADAKAKGVKFGRKPTLTPHQQKEARKRIEAGETQRSVARTYNVSQATISRLGA
jgi:hypothetical protein